MHITGSGALRIAELHKNHLELVSYETIGVATHPSRKKMPVKSVKIDEQIKELLSEGVKKA